MDKSELIAQLQRIDQWREIFAVLVAVGIVGEVFFAFRYSSRNKDLQLILNEEEKASKLQIEELRRTNLLLQTDLQRTRNRQEPRVTMSGKLNQALEGKPPGQAEILYQEGDGEVYQFAGWLKSLLLHAKWNISEPRPVGDTVSGSYSGIPADELRKFPPPMKLGAAPVGITIVANRKTMSTLGDKDPSPLKGLLKALADSDIRAGLGQDDTALPDGLLRIVIAPR